jgi:hypothetical protein
VDELPRDARAYLAQLKDVHDPDDPAAKERVRARVAAAAGLAVGLGAASGALAQVGKKGLWAQLVSHKVAATLGALSVAGAAAVTLPKLASPLPVAEQAATVGAPAARRPVQAPRPVPQGGALLRSTDVAATPVPPDAPAAPFAPPVEPLQAGAASARGSLDAELGLLERADRALVARRPGEALRLIAQHAKRFPWPILREERLALDVIARCQLGHADAPSAAERFLAAHPDAVLGGRVRLSCAPR